MCVGSTSAEPPRNYKQPGSEAEFEGRGSKALLRKAVIPAAGLGILSETREQNERDFARQVAVRLTKNHSSTSRNLARIRGRASSKTIEWLAFPYGPSSLTYDNDSGLNEALPLTTGSSARHPRTLALCNATG